MSTTTRNKSRPGPSGRVGATPSTGRAGSDRFEDRRRALRRRWWLKVALVVLVLALAVGAVWAVLWSSLLGVSRVEVVGTHRSTPQAVEQVARVPVGRPLARVDLDAIRARVETMTSVASASVTRSFPHTVRITIVERTPVAVAGPSFGPFELVDATGVDLGRTSIRPKSLPLIQLDPGTADPATFRSAAAVAAALPPALVAQVVAISASSPDGVSLALVGGARVRWGGSDRSADKAQVLHALLAHRARIYDVSAPDAPTTTG